MKPELESAFLEEGRQLLAAMRRGLNGGESARAIPELFRCAHMLKGNVRLVGFLVLEPLVVPMAECLRAAKRRGELTAEQVAAVSETVSACQDILEGRKTADTRALSARLWRAAVELGSDSVAKPTVRVLLIEDSDLQAAIIQKELALCRGVVFTVERKDRLAAGLESISKGEFDVVLLDLNLPDGQGLETLTGLSARAPSLPTVVLTIADDDSLAMAALRSGAQDYLVKGQIDARMLPRVIRYAIERKGVEETLRKARAELERRVEERTAELRKANRELSLFASAATHELRAPLRQIVGWGDLLKEGFAGDLGKEGLALVREMQDAARRQGDLIDSLRELTRVTTQGRPLEPVELDAVVGEIARELAPLFIQAGGRLSIDRLPALRADRVQMGQLFRNLISNAFKYRDQERPPIVAIRCRPLGTSSVEIAVEDNGIGFEQKYAERIFEPFQRLHGPGTLEGAGMGLAICAMIVARHAGSLAARGAPGSGATFTVTLPLVEPGK
jgi:signal transduction histidine kinase